MQSEGKDERKRGRRLDRNSYSLTQYPRSRAGQRTACRPCDEIPQKKHRCELPVPGTEDGVRPREAKQNRCKRKLEQRVGTPRRGAVDCARDDSLPQASFHFMAQSASLNF